MRTAAINIDLWQSATTNTFAKGIDYDFIFQGNLFVWGKDNRKKDKRFVETSNEEIESKRLKMNAEKTLKQNESTDTRLREYLIERKKDNCRKLISDKYQVIRICEANIVWYPELLL
jgi:hypothetical protein